MPIENDPTFIAMQRELEELKARNAKAARAILSSKLAQALRDAGAPPKLADWLAPTLIGSHVDLEKGRFVEWSHLDLEEGARRFVADDAAGMFGLAAAEAARTGATTTTPPADLSSDAATWVGVGRGLRMGDPAFDPAQRSTVDWEDLARRATRGGQS